MKTPSFLIICLAMIPCVAQSQNASTNTSPSSARNDKRIEKSLPEVKGPVAVDLRTPDEFTPSDLSPSLGNWSVARWDATVDQPLPRISIGKNDFGASGFFVDVFHAGPRPEQGAGRTFLGVPVTNIVVANPWPAGGWKRTYVKWGERDQPWSATVDRRSAGPESTLLALHF